MKRLALVLAAAVLGTGCIITDDDPPLGFGDLDVSWRFRNFDGSLAGDYSAANPGCSEAGVTEVDLSLWRGSTRVAFQTFACQETAASLPGAFLQDVREGTYSYELTGYRLDEPVFQDGGTVSILPNHATQVLATLDVLTPQSLTLYYSLNGVLTNCSTTPSINYALYNQADVLVSGGEIDCDPVANGFSVTNLSVGTTYYLEFLQAVDSIGESRFELCAVNVRHTGFPVFIDLAPAPDASCDFLF
jgi:hypothetical protein